MLASTDLIPRCLMLVDFESGSYDRDSWFNIYAGRSADKDDIPRYSIPRSARFSNVWPAGVAVNVLCVQRGYAGRAIHIGKLDIARLETKKRSQEVSINLLQVAMEGSWFHYSPSSWEH